MDIKGIILKWDGWVTGYLVDTETEVILTEVSVLSPFNGNMVCAPKVATGELDVIFGN